MSYSVLMRHRTYPVGGDPMVRLFRKKREKVPDPLIVALDATVADLRRLGSDLRETARVVEERVSSNGVAK